jgi:hypothetical protein
MYRMEAVKIDTLLSGEIDCADFERKLSERKDKPAILNVNIGTCQCRFFAHSPNFIFTHFRIVGCVFGG